MKEKKNEMIKELKIHLDVWGIDITKEEIEGLKKVVKDYEEGKVKYSEVVDNVNSAVIHIESHYSLLKQLAELLEIYNFEK